MKNKDYQEILQAHNHRLIRIDSKKKFIEEMIKNLEGQYKVVCDDWDETWREKTSFVLENESKVEA